MDDLVGPKTEPWTHLRD